MKRRGCLPPRSLRRWPAVVEAGFDPAGLDLEASATFVPRETERRSAVVRRLGIALE